ncbi:MAG: hypothetical protein EHM35_13615 [Planctomycetaceae bacterium]|nr:MAG: hypothetical protein EHM35_13615 [Planctomycetaceae bacterium]
MNEAMKNLLRTGTPVYLRDLNPDQRSTYRDDPAVKRAGDSDEVVVGIYLDHAITGDEYDKL